MRGRLIEEIVIPARYGRAVVVKKGQVLRIHQIDGGQCGDCAFYNAHDYKEWFHVGQSWAINGILKTGTSKTFQYFYSKPPRENVMFTTLEDTYKNHWGNNGGRCSPRLYKLREGADNHRSCQENIAEALAPYGMTSDDVTDIFNIFMNVDLHTDGSFTIKPSTATKDDYLDIRAEMDVLAAVSACPSDRAPTNGGKCRPLGLKIFES